MFSQIHYLVRSKADGSYLAAHPNTSGGKGYLLMFQEHSDALSYLNTHGAGVADKFGVESITGSQLKGLLTRWGFAGVGIVKDPLLPTVDFLSNS
ncbi:MULTISPECIES: hypothetical protein [unclassified Microcoleus]|uniref:hypothetical protein n=1 Tax=unclassified Microcoleus TaxID=2642155 RepID=UPI001688D6EC|nr:MULTISPECIES: hypothetical protein [unclassified Microcoleus]MBD1940569.1 hypothetical protein [Microcoleus sp. FACHB-68]MBD2040511.1 hypothetical protein [Microcoleus sp. FACHB-672]